MSAVSVRRKLAEQTDDTQKRTAILADLRKKKRGNHANVMQSCFTEAAANVRKLKTCVGQKHKHIPPFLVCLFHMHT